jgi:hypothetical protein
VHCRATSRRFARSRARPRVTARSGAPARRPAARRCWSRSVSACRCRSPGNRRERSAPAPQARAIGRYMRPWCSSRANSSHRMVSCRRCHRRRAVKHRTP